MAKAHLFHALQSRPARGAWVEMPCTGHGAAHRWRRAPQGARGLKSSWLSVYLVGAAGRAPQGARGLKYRTLHRRHRQGPESRPARGAWVEMPSYGDICAAVEGRAPQGARGLKSGTPGPTGPPERSRPARGAWVEIKSSSAPSRWIYRRAPQGARGLK